MDYIFVFYQLCLVWALGYLVVASASLIFDGPDTVTHSMFLMSIAFGVLAVAVKP